jgi:hypothetical protein
MMNRTKEDSYKHLSEFSKNTNEQLKEFKRIQINN